MMNENQSKASLTANAILLCAAFVFAFLYFTHTCDCYESGQTVIVHDTIWPNPEPKVIAVKVPEPVRSISKKDFIPTRKDSLRGSTSVHSWTAGDARQVSGSPDYEPTNCDSVYFYSDTTLSAMPDSAIIIVVDTLMDNRIYGRSVLYANRTPTITTTITHVKKERWKVYVGGSFTLPHSLKGWGAGPAAMLTIPKIGGIGYSFDAKNKAHTASVLALIRFRK